MTKPLSLAVAVTIAASLAGAVLFLARPSSTFLQPAIAFASDILGFTKQVSSSSQTNATEPSVAVDRADGTVYVAWQASGTHVARSDNGGRPVPQEKVQADVGDVGIPGGGAKPCA